MNDQQLAKDLEELVAAYNYQAKQFKHPAAIKWKKKHNQPPELLALFPVPKNVRKELEWMPHQIIESNYYKDLIFWWIYDYELTPEIQRWLEEIKITYKEELQYLTSLELKNTK